MKKNRSILLSLLAGALLLTAPTGCSDANEPESKDIEVQGFKERDPAGYAAYTAALRQWKQQTHPVVYGCLDNAPDRSVSERDFLRSVPDSIDMVALRHSDRLSDFDRADMTLVRGDYGTRVLYYVADQGQAQGAVAAVQSGQFDGAVVADPRAAATVANALRGSLLIFEGSPMQIDESLRAAFRYYIIDLSGATDHYDVDYAVRYATGMSGVGQERLLLTVTPAGNITDASGVSRGAISAAVHEALALSPAAAGIGVNRLGDDYYDPDCIYPRVRGAIQTLNPAAK